MSETVLSTVSLDDANMSTNTTNQALWLLFLLASVSLVVLSHLIVPVDPSLKALSFGKVATAGDARSAFNLARILDVTLVIALILQIACHGVLWWRSQRASSETDDGGFRFACLAGAGVWLIQLAAVPWTSADVFLYLAHASTWREFGSNPYLVAPAGNLANPFLQLGSWSNGPAQYGPLGILVSAGLLRPSLGPWGNLVVSRLFGVACLAGAFLCAGGIARNMGLRLGRGTWLLLITSPLLLTDVGAAVHNDAWVALLLLASIWATLSGRWGLAVPLFAASAAVKYSTLVLMPLFALGFWRSPPRGAFRWLALATGVAVTALGALLLAWLFGGIDTIAHGFSAAAHMRTKSIVWLVCYSVAAKGFAVGPIVTASRLIVLVLSIVIAVRVKRKGLAPDGVLATYFLFLILGVAWFQSWYVVVLLPVCALATSRGARDTVMLFAATSLLGVYGVFFLTRSWSPSTQIAMTLVIFVPVLVALLRHWRAMLADA